MYIIEAFEAEISGEIPLILREIWVFPNLSENSPLIFQTH